VSSLLVFSPLMLIWSLVVLKFGLFVESALKIDIRHFIKEKAFLIAEV